MIGIFEKVNAMAMVINTNMAAINASRILEGTSKNLSTAMERLTSGLRINKAADDAAGLAVVTGMTTQIRGTEQAIRNANDGISLIQTMDGAVEEIVNMFQRMRELGVQAMNGTYNDDNRAQMNAEFFQLRDEVDRVVTTTKFNEMPLLDNVYNISIHVGWETGPENRIVIETEDIRMIALQFGLPNADLLTQANAQGTIALFDNALSVISEARANWGALQNRLDYTVSNLTNINENIMGARSQIQDADYARESAQMARLQVLQQAGMTMLSQANQQSRSVLSLLR